ncbi:HIT domain-containing protein [candidate division WOR-3 bacterium]|nr:HIT domain-containing protein [candidate division WOR-3 bacterium]
MKTLWAPWRAEYIYCAIGKPSPAKRHCLFCRLLKTKDDKGNLILLRGRHAFVMMNRFPYNNGHLMVAPNRHTMDLETLSAAESRELFQLTQKSLAALRRALKPHGFNVGANLGRVAGAGVAGHVHVHIVPRWLGDVNYMPVLAETKVISEHLSETYDRLRRQFGSRSRRGHSPPRHQDTKARTKAEQQTPDED